MPFNFPKNRKEVSDRIATDVQSQLPTSNPHLKNSFLFAMITGMAGRIFDFFLQLEILTIEMFPDTATGLFLERWGSYKGVTRLSGTKGTGNVVVTGTVGGVIASGLLLATSDGVEYISTASATIDNHILSVSSLTRSGTTATATIGSNHNLASGMSITIAGAGEAQYNGVVTITATSTTKFTYTVDAAAPTPATGTITAASNSAVVPVESVGFGQSSNQDSGTEIFFSSPISGVDNTAIVPFDAISGGIDIESDADLRVRVIERYANPVSTFNKDAIEKKIEEVAGITRVFIREVTPDVGQVTIYFTRDNDTNIIPDAGEVATAKAKVLEIKPAHVIDADVIVLAPTGVSVDFTFATLTPNTSTMQAALRANLEALFQDDTDVGSDLKSFAYESTIFQTIDPEEGISVSAFVLTLPVGDITIASNEIPTLGNITFP